MNYCGVDMKLKVLILLAAYNGKKYIRDMIDSILGQDCDCWELIVSDDGEDTSEILNEYAQKYPTKITHYRANQRFGSAQKHFLHLLERFHEAQYIMFCDQDDFWHPDKVRKSLELIKTLEAGNIRVPAMIHTDLRVVDSDLNVMSPSFMQYANLDGHRLAINNLIMQNVVTGCTVMINQSLAELVCSVDIPYDSIVMHDWWIALIATCFGRIAYLDEATIDYRQHGGNVLGAQKNSIHHFIKRINEKDSIKSSITCAAEQAGALIESYGSKMSKEQLAALSAFAECTHKSKIARLYTYMKFGLWKMGMVRKAGQFIFG